MLYTRRAGRYQWDSCVTVENRPLASVYTRRAGRYQWDSYVTVENRPLASFLVARVDSMLLTLRRST